MNDPSPKPVDLKWHIKKAMGFLERWADPLIQMDPLKAVAEGHIGNLGGVSHTMFDLFYL